MRFAVIAVASGMLLALVGCSTGHRGASGPPGTSGPSGRSSAAGASAAAGPSGTVGASGSAACAELYARLQQVTAALDASSELIANSLGPQDLSDRIGVEEGQLRQSAQLMASAPVPSSLAATNQQLVAALQEMTADFARAKAPAAQGDFAAASQAMTDNVAVQRIVDASTRIEKACGH